MEGDKYFSGRGLGITVPLCPQPLPPARGSRKPTLPLRSLRSSCSRFSHPGTSLLPCLVPGGRPLCLLHVSSLSVPWTLFRSLSELTLLFLVAGRFCQEPSAIIPSKCSSGELLLIKGGCSTGGWPPPPPPPPQPQSSLAPDSSGC